MNPRSVVLLLAFLVSCAKSPAPREPLDDSRDLAGLFDGRNNTLYVRSGLADTLLGLIGARKEGEGYSAVVKEQPITFTVVSVPYPGVYSPQHWGPFDTTKEFISKFYFDAECGQGHPGFVAPCMATFGPHRAFGNSMTWQVNNWKSCTRGKSWCVEVWKPVGTVTYYPGFNCADTMFVTRPIMEFRCD